MSGFATSRRGVVLGLGLLAGCASPEPAFFRLTAVPGAPRPPGAGTVKLRRVGLPGYLDRPGIVRAGPGGRLDVLGGARWAEPLGGMVERVLAENLGQRLPGRTVFGAGSVLSADGDRTVEVELRRFEADGAGAVELVAQVGLRGPQSGSRGAGAAPRELRTAANAAGPGAAATAAAMSEALGRLSDELAVLLDAPPVG